MPCWVPCGIVDTQNALVCARESNMAAKHEASEQGNLSGKKRRKSSGKPIMSSSQNEEVDFPRGGASALSPLEVRRIKQQAEKDILFGANSVEEEKKKKKKPKSKGKSPGSSAVPPTSTVKHIESLSFKKLCVGMKLLGVVKEVSDFEVVISLPNGLSGFVHVMDINAKLIAALTTDDHENEDDIPSLEDMFTVNTLVVCVIKELFSNKHGHRKIKLSLRPDDINTGVANIVQGMVLSGYVSSVEDHGFVISFGIAGKSGFLPKKSSSKELKEGQHIQVLAESVAAEGRVIGVSADQEKIKKAMITTDMKLRFSSLLPGMLIKTKVVQCAPHGLSVSFLEMFEGSINIAHLPNCGGDGQNLDKLYNIKSKHVARILYVNPKNKVVSLSLLPPILELEAHSFGSFTIGDIIDDAMVTRVDQGHGLLMALDKGVNGFVHLSQVSDTHLEKLGKKHKAGTSHRCRVLGFNAVDGLVSLTLKKSVIEKPFLRYDDVQPGAIVDCTIITLEKFGMLVSLSDHIKGLVTSLHLADIALKHPEKKLKDGKPLKCRVLSVNPAQRRLQLTNKKTLVSSTLPAITQYSEAVPGMTTHGFITSIKDYGCLVTFYNNVKGLVPRNQLGIQESEDPRSVFYLGQVVSCHVVSCAPDEGKLKLSFKAGSVAHSPKNTPQVTLKTGSLVDVDVVCSSGEGLDVMIQPSGCPALLPVYNLSDHVSHWTELLSLYSPADGKPITIKNVLYFGVNRHKTHIVSLKPSIKTAASSETLLTEFDAIRSGMVLHGFVKLLMPYGVFIEFAPGILGLAPNSFIANQFVSDAASHFKIGQSVTAKVSEVDSERRRFLVSLKQSDLCTGLDWDSASGGMLLEDYLTERRTIMEHMAHKSEDVKRLMALSIGQCVEAKVSKVKKNGITLDLPDGIQGFVSHQLAQGVSCQEGEVVKGCVLDYNTDKNMVAVTLMPDVIAKEKKSKPKKLKGGQAMDCIVQLIKPNYMVVCLPTAGHRIAFAPTRMHLNDIRDASKRFAIGQKYRALIHECADHCIVIPEEKNISRENLKPGAITTVEVRVVKPLQMNVQLGAGGLHGRVHITHATDETTQGEWPFKSFNSGDKVEAKVLGFRDSKSHKFLPITHKNFTKAVAEVSIKPSDLMKTASGSSSGETTSSDAKKLEDYTSGEEVQAFVKSTTDHCVWMVVSTLVSGRIELLHASSDIKVLSNLASHFKPGYGYTCTVLGVDKDHELLDLSLTVKPSKELAPDQVVPGRVTRVTPTSGLFIQLPLHKCGMAGLTDLGDRYIENPLEQYKVRQIVRCCILSKKEDGHYDLSLRPSRTSVATTQEQKVDESVKPDREIKSLADLDVGDIVRGYVKCCKDIGVFVSLAHNIVARVQIKNLSHFFVKDWKPLFPLGKLVTGKIKSIDPSTGRIELSLKGKDTGGADPAPNPKQHEKERKGEKRKKAKVKTVEAVDKEEEVDSDDDADKIIKRLKTDDSDSDIAEEESADESEPSSESDDEQEEDASPPSNKRPRLQISAGFKWNAGDEGASDEAAHAHYSSDDMGDSETETSEQVTRKKTKRQKRASKKAEEDFLYRTEQALLDADHTPESAEDFDRLVLSSPNNSVTWLQYMAFHLHTTEIDKARAVAERALKTISFREEREKLNLWVALMNLENLYGTQDSLVKVFERALQQNEPKKVFFHLITIYTKSDKNELAEQLLHSMTKRFSQSKKVWIEFGRFFMRSGNAESARKLLQRALKSLPNRKHVATIVQFALMEFKHGDPQRGQTVLEGVLSNYPKRTDLWSVYIDMMGKQGHPDTVRQIFERVIHLNLSSRKMKFLFKKYLEFEREHGDDMSIENVKTKAMEYVESKVALS